jgi:hypothetical protein
MSDDVLPTTTPDLSGLRQRRAHLSRATEIVVRALASSATSGAGPPAAELVAAVGELAHTWQLHVERSEDGDGLLAQVILDAPRVAPIVARIRREHRQIAAELEQVTATLALARSAAEREAGEAAVRAVLDQVARHRGAAGDLVHEAYHIDIGGE